MRKFFAATLVALLFAGTFTATAQAAAPKAGAKCSKLNQSQSFGGYKFTCLKSGKKLIWKLMGLVPPAKTGASFSFSQTFSTDDGYKTLFTGPCELDENLSPELKEVQQYFYSFNRCAGQLQIGKYTLGSKRPATTFEPASKYSNFEPCKITTPQDSRSNLGYTTASPGRNEYENKIRQPSPNSVIQLVPIYSSDSAKPTKTPAEDYKLLLDNYKNWIEYSSDFGSNVVIRVPNEYIKMPTPLAEYGLKHPVNWTEPANVKFNQDLLRTVDPLIDFSGANMAIVVPPAGTEAYVFGQAAIGPLNTNEGRVGNVMSEYAALAKNPLSSQYSNLAHPFWWIHEMMHAGVGFDDHYGDTKQDLNTEYGMGHLTLMTPWGGDLTTWEKLRLGFMRESQIQCKSDTSTSTHWIAPSTVQTQESKAIVIPISSTKAVLIETLRPGGLFYKHPLQSQGALVYEIDLLKDGHGMGMKISLPIGRSVVSNQVFMASAPLKQGESTISNGFKITVVESGTFGDVIKIERATS